MNIVSTLLSRPHIGSAAVRLLIGGGVGALLFGAFRGVLHYTSFGDPFYEHYFSFETLFAATRHGDFPDAAVLPAAIVAVLIALLVADVWKSIYRLP